MKRSRRSKVKRSRRSKVKRSKVKRSKVKRSKVKRSNKKKDGVGVVSKIKNFFTSKTDRCIEAMKILIDFEQKSNKKEFDEIIKKYCANTNYIDVLFLLSCKYGNFIKAKELLDRGANPACVDIFGRTAIIYCVIYNNFNKLFILDLLNRISNTLLKNKDAMERYVNYILMRRTYVYHSPHDERESFIIDTYLNTYLNKKDNNDNNVLFYIVNNCNIDFLNVIAKYFTPELDNYSVIDEYYTKTEINNNNIIFYMVKNCDNDFFNTFIKTTKKYMFYLDGETLFTYILRLNKPKMFNILFNILLDDDKKNIITKTYFILDKNNLGMNTLLYASEKGYLDIIKNLINLISECKKFDKIREMHSELYVAEQIFIRNKEGMTPLIFAAKNNYLNIVKELLDNPIISNYYKKNESYEYHSFINMRDNKGNTALDYACYNINNDMYNYLISEGAIDLKNRKEYMDKIQNAFLFTKSNTGYLGEFKEKVDDPYNIFSEALLKYI